MCNRGKEGGAASAFGMAKTMVMMITSKAPRVMKEKSYQVFV